MPRRFLLAGLVAAIPSFAPAQTPDLYDIDVIRDIRLTFAQSNWWQLLLQNYQPEINIPADMVVDNVTYRGVGVRFRGNTSYTQLPIGSEKKSFNLETDFTIPGQDLYGYEHLNLNNGFHDPTFLREFLTYWIMRQHGPAPKCNFVRLWLNNTYWGIYINVQQPNKDMMREWFRSNDGNRYRGFPTSGTFGNGRTALTWLGSDVNLYLAAYQAKQGDGTDLMQMINVLNNTPAAQLQAQLPAQFSVDQFYRYAAVMNVCTQTDSYIGSGKDHYLYHDPVHGDFHMFPFDLNEALAENTSLDIWYQTTSTIKPAFSKTLQFADWRERYKAHVRSVVEQTFNWATLGPLVLGFHNKIKQDVLNDTKKIYSSQLFLDNLTMPVFADRRTIPGLQPFIQARETYLRGRADLSAPRTALAQLAHAPAKPNPTQPVTVTVTASSLAASVQLWWRRIGPFTATPMFDDGLHGDGSANDGVWGATLAAQAPGSIVDYYVEARTATGLATYLPGTAEHASGRYVVQWPTGNSPIRLNEFVAQNVGGIVDENNQHEDWLELYNDSAQSVNVGGYWVTDDLTKPKYQIPANTTIPARGTLLIWCDEDGTQGPLHANFKLDANGEKIALFAADGITLLDSLEFGIQVADVSVGRVLDGGLPYVSFRSPTPRSRNELPACGTRTFGGQDSRAHKAQLTLGGSPRIGTSPVLSIQGAPASGTASIYLGAAAAHIDLTPLGLAGEVLLLDPQLLVGPYNLSTNSAGDASSPFPIPFAPELVGVKLLLQAFAAGSGQFDSTNALEIVFCP